VVSDFTVAVPGGTVVALVGRSGAGKTTVTDLVARFHDPRARIRVNGIDIRDFRLRTYRDCSPSSNRTPSCSTGRCGTTSPMVAMMPRTRDRRRRPAGERA